MAELPRSVELILSGSLDIGYTLHDAVTRRCVAHGLVSLAEVVTAARRHGATEIWQQPTDGRGQRLGTAVPLAWRVPRR
jgi:hypothetical protein